MLPSNYLNLFSARIFTSVVVLSILFLFQNKAHSQELPQNLLYANKNLKFEEIYKVGEYSVLHYIDALRQKKRLIYLLDERNIVVDTMNVRSTNHILMRSDSTFALKSLGDIFEYEIAESKLQTTLAIDVSAVFSDDYIDPYFIVNDYIIGEKNLKSENYLSSYYYLHADSLELLQGIPKRTDEYIIDDSTAVFLLSEEAYEEVSGKTYEGLPIRPLFDKKKSLVMRVASLARNRYGSFSSSLHNNLYTFYDWDAAKVFSIDVSGQPKLVNEIELPIADRNKEGWKYLFDFKLKKHYAIKRIETTVIPEGIKQRKANKIEDTYDYQLYVLTPEASTFKLRPLYKLPFDPMLIDGDLVYEIVQESKKGSAIFFHPLDPNYLYKKSRMIYSGN